MTAIEQAARWTDRDHDHHAHQEATRHQVEMRTLELARLGALALAEEFPDIVNHYDLALTVIRALDDDGIVFARMGLRDDGGEVER